MCFPQPGILQNTADLQAKPAATKKVAGALVSSLTTEEGVLELDLGM